MRQVHGDGCQDYIFSYKEVKKEKTFSTTRDGIVFVQVELNDELNNKDEFWSKFKHGVATFKSQLPPNVLAIQVMDDFGDTSALLTPFPADAVPGNSDCRQGL